MLLSNPDLARLITDAIGDRWLRHAEEELARLEPFASDPSFLQEWQRVKQSNKGRLAHFLTQHAAVTPDPLAIFDVQVKRIHEYKRQHLNVLHVITLYNRLRWNRAVNVTPRTVVFGGKAAPGYAMAKLIIRLINGVAEVVNKDPMTRDRLMVVFLPNFNVTLGQRIYPAADLSEQISTAGKEASGTGNMKFAMNGALTIGTLDGANVEIREAVGEENFFLFGLTDAQIDRLKAGGYQPRRYYESDPALAEALDQIACGYFSPGEPDLFRPLVAALFQQDEYMLLADYASYVACQEQVAETFQAAQSWSRMSVLNVARVGRFSSDRAILEYAQKVWNISPSPIVS